MARQRYTLDQLSAAVSDMEKKSQEGVLKPKKCSNCKNSWYRYVPPTGSFKKPSEYCGCRKKNVLVNPDGCCEAFDPR